VALAQALGATVSVSLIELGGTQPRSWSAGGDRSMVAASTYKLPLLMAEAQGIAAGTIHATDVLCYIDSDWEDGWFGDYVEGLCFSRAELDQRAGAYSDNTAAHILVRYMGGTVKLNQYAQAHGAMESQFYDPNQTTANDLARLLANEQTGAAGGAAAQQYLYSLLTHTQYESGVPAGVPATTTVVHKIGDIDQSVNDAAIVLNGPQGAYALVVMVEMANGDGWSLISQISNRVWQFEAAR
jgi:beta-lactamase class A